MVQMSFGTNASPPPSSHDAEGIFHCLLHSSIVLILWKVLLKPKCFHFCLHYAGSLPAGHMKAELWLGIYPTQQYIVHCPLEYANLWQDIKVHDTPSSKDYGWQRLPWKPIRHTLTCFSCWEYSQKDDAAP